jgi:plastocyanin
MPRPFRLRRTVAGVLLVTVVLALAACGGSASPAPASAVPTSAPVTSASTSPTTGGGSEGGTAVIIEGFAFSPATLTVAAGTTVTWTNRDSAPHTATADDSSFDSPALAAGATFSQVFATPGTFAYHCAIHPRMTATLVVN